MGSSREGILTGVIAKLQAVYELPHPKTSPEYMAMLEVYIDQLKPYDQWELTEGINVLISTKLSRKWPSVGEIKRACDQCRKDRREFDPGLRPQKQLTGPKYEPVTGEERERNGARMKTLGEWLANGNLLQKDETGAYRYSLEDCKAEAARRQAERL